MILKSYIVEQNLDILKNYQATLIYGENSGVKNDIKEKIKNQNKDCEIINFFESDILTNDFLYENITNESLFTKQKVIFIHESSDKIFDKVLECLEKENNNVKIYNMLRKNAKLVQKHIKIISTYITKCQIV